MGKKKHLKRQWRKIDTQQVRKEGMHRLAGAT